MAELVQAFSAINYPELKNSYTAIKNPDGTATLVTDLPTTYTSFTLNGQHKAIKDYVGAPQALRELEDKIDAIAGSKRRVAIEAPPVRDEVRHGWNLKSVGAQKLFAEAAERRDVDARIGERTILQRARGVEVVKLLIAAGADVNARSKRYFGPPLNFADAVGDEDSIKAPA